MIFVVLAQAIGVYIVTSLLYKCAQNYKAHQYFKSRSPKLPVLPKPNIISGHIFELMFNQKNWRHMSELHKKLGHSFGLYVGDVPVILTTNIKLMKLVAIEKGNLHVNRSSFNTPIKEYYHSLFGLKGDDWRRCRKMISPAFSTPKLKTKEMSECMQKVLQNFLQSLERRLAASKLSNSTGKRYFDANIGDLVSRYSFAVLLSIGFKQENVIDFDAASDAWVELFAEGIGGADNKLLGIPMLFPSFMPILAKLANYSGFGRLRNKIVGYVEEVIKINQKHRKLYIEQYGNQKDFSTVESFKGFHRTFVDSMVDAYVDKKISREELISNMWSLVIAGYATTADTLTCLAWLLAMHPEVQERLRTAFKEDGLDNDYIDWCIYETLRWFPAVPLAFGRVLEEDVTVDDLLYPKDSFVIFSAYDIHRNPEHWPEPNLFKPERWQDKNSLDPNAFIAFGHGIRECPGKKLSFIEIKAVLQRMLAKYRFEKAPNTVEKYEFSSPMLLLTVTDEPIIVRVVEI